MHYTTRSFAILTGILALLLFSAGCIGEETAVDGDTVRVHYTGMLDDGSIFDSSVERDTPLEFTLGKGELIPGFEHAVRGMSVGEEKTVTIPSEEAYGSWDEERVLVLPRDMVPDEVAVVGQSLYQPQGVVISVDDEAVVINQNHHLAGEDLTFTITLVEIL